MQKSAALSVIASGSALYEAAALAYAVRGWFRQGKDSKLDRAPVKNLVAIYFRNGAIIWHHEGGQLISRPDVRPALDAVRPIIPSLVSRGFEFQTVSQLLCPTK